MIALEKRLLERGYRCDYKTPSSMANCDNRYIKNGNQVIVGLHEKGKPITLISHRHLFYEDDYMVTDDDRMNRVLESHGADKIIDTIEND